MTRLLVGIMAAIALGFGAEAQMREVDAKRSRIDFVYTLDRTVRVEGRFPKWQAALVFDEKQPTAAHVRIEIDLRSIDSGSTDGDAEARGRLWFDTDRHASATFVSDAVKRVAEGRYEAFGRLTIKGRTREMTIPFTVQPAAGGALAAQGRLTVRRLLFGVGEGHWADTSQVADDIEVRFNLLIGPLR